jgi:hypothetical protein
LCPHGGEYRVTLVKNRTLRVWCTCLAEYPDGTWVPEKSYHFDWLEEIDLSESPRPIWQAHCEKVEGTEYVGHELKVAEIRKVTREVQIKTSSNVNEYLK